MIVTQIRTEAAMDRTHGLVFIDGDLFCHSLEDTARPDGVKIAKETCIPAGLYKLGMETSPKYGADTLTIFDVPMFQGIRIHGHILIVYHAGLFHNGVGQGRLPVIYVGNDGNIPDFHG